MYEPKHEVCKHRDVGMDREGPNPIGGLRDYDIGLVLHDNYDPSSQFTCTTTTSEWESLLA